MYDMQHILVYRAVVASVILSHKYQTFRANEFEAFLHIAKTAFCLLNTLINVI